MVAVGHRLIMDHVNHRFRSRRIATDESTWKDIMRYSFRLHGPERTRHALRGSNCFQITPIHTGSLPHQTCVLSLFLTTLRKPLTLDVSIIHDNSKVRKHDTSVLTIESCNIFDKTVFHVHTLETERESLRMPERTSFKFCATASFCIFSASMAGD